MDYYQDRIRWVKRNLDGGISYRKLAIVGFFVLAFVLYVGPYIFRLLTAQKSKLLDPVGRCLSDRLLSFQEAAGNFDADVRHQPEEDGENTFVPFVGNGMIGVVVQSDGQLYLKNGRVLSMAVPYQPVVSLNLRLSIPAETTVIDYISGMVHQFHCFYFGKSTIDVHYVHYAHRTMPAVYVQEFKVTNPTENDVQFDVQGPEVIHWDGLTSTTVVIDDDEGGGGDLSKYALLSGQLPIPDSAGQFFALAIVTSHIPDRLTVLRESTKSVVVFISVHYMGPVKAADCKDAIEEAVRQAKSNFSRVLKLNSKRLQDEHKKVWQQLWSSGFAISYSRALSALNGDKINATIYYVVSHTRSPLHEVDISSARRQELVSLLGRPDRCYDGHHTLQASTLWSHLSTVEDVVNVVSLWKLTLDKQGCHTMLHAGADGAMQAILLSFGALKFSNHHLEFCTHPKDLHRDYAFRRINYGNATHVNISVTVGEDNKAVLSVALDRSSDRNYYACDGGCLDSPVQLGTQQKQFPVKLTDPPTAILYITSDKQHMEELKHTIHVKEVIEEQIYQFWYFYIEILL